MIEAGLIVSRFLHYLASFALFGGALFPFYAFGGASEARGARSRAARLIAPAAWTALATAILWFLFTSAGMAGNTAAIADPHIWTVVANTAFGRVWLIRIALGLTLVALVTARAPRIAITGMAGVLVASLALVGHAVEGEGAYALLHETADAVHVLAGAIWIGALAILAGLARGGDDSHLLSKALARFSPVGLWAVIAIAISGLVNATFTVGPRNLPALLDTPYGTVLAAKLVLFGGMLLLAAAHRFVLAPRLAEALGGPPPGTAALRTSLAAEAILGVLVLAAAGWLGTLPPPANA